MSEHRYPVAALRADYVRAGAGFVICAVLLAGAQGELVPSLILGLGALLFAAFGIRTGRRQATSIRIDDEGISTSGGRRVTLRWGQLTRLTLRYYATRRDRAGGWMQLNLAAGRTRLAIESTLDGFNDVARRAAEAARVNGVALDDATAANLLALGLRTGSAP